MFILTVLPFRNIWCNFLGRTYPQAYILVYLSSHYILVFNEESPKGKKQYQVVKYMLHSRYSPHKNDKYTKYQRAEWIMPHIL